MSGTVTSQAMVIIINSFPGEVEVSLNCGKLRKY